MELNLKSKLQYLFKFSETQILITMSIVVGAGTAFGAIAFIKLIEYCRELFFGYSEKVMTTLVGSFDYWTPLIPMVGALIVGPIVYKFASEARGHGVPEVMDAVARKGGIIRPRVAIAKTVASAICIGSGGSAGREGPIVQIGSAIGSGIGQLFKMSGSRVKILVGCGAAAGISAVFNAPIAGVIFSLEVILGDFAIKTFSPVLLASVVASVVTRAFMGDHPAFDVPDYSLVSALEIPLYMILGVVCGGVAVLFTKTLSGFETFFEKLKMPPMLKPALGGLILGIIGMYFPQVFADGYETIKLTLYGNMMVWLMLILIFLKILATSLTLGSGNSGGIFAPSLFIGAVTGGTFGYFAHLLFPAITATAGAYALVGMAALVAGTTHAPITALLIIFEMTSDYRIILPLMVAVVFSTLFARKLFEPSIYTIKLIAKGIFLKAGKDTAILRASKVSEVMDKEFETIPTNMPLVKIMEKIESSKGNDFIVIDKQERFVGTLSLQHILGIITQHTLDYLVIAKDIASTDYTTVCPDDDLEIAQKRFALGDFPFIPVVNREDPSLILGILRREELTHYYNRKLVESFKQ
ncbi:MAG: chloride channel protein [candidate division Zixibacteria bacterium]|nr:chloride channel protein [candidate division Zixibacteria bacterium]